MRRSRLRWMVPLLGLAALSLGADYRGCGASPGPSEAEEGVALPVAAGCVLDADCAGVDICSEVRCLVGECVVTGLATDRDGDGFAPAPCGMDCQDTAADRFPGAREFCDGVDQDCDGTVDEDAIGATPFDLTDTLENSTLVAAGDAFWLVGDTEADATLATYSVDPESPGAVSTLDVQTGLPRGVAGFPDGRIVAVGPSETASFTIYEFAPDAGGYALSRQEEVGEPADLLAVHVRRIGAELYVVYDVRVAGGPEQRGLLHPVAGAIDLTPDPDRAPPDLAFDGTHLVVTAGSRSLQFLSAAGAPTALRDLPGGFSAGALADGEGAVVAAYRDAFDHALIRVSSEGRNPSVLAPSGMRLDAVTVHRVVEGVLVLRRQDMRLRGWVLSDDLSTYVATLGPGTLTDSAAVIGGVSVAVRSDGLAAIHARRPFSGDSVAYLRCETP